MSHTTPGRIGCALAVLLLVSRGPGSTVVAGEAPERLPIAVGPAWLLVELADSEEERRRGLMHRDRLEPGHGMLFVYPEPRPVVFWMKNTRIPLDLLYLDARGRLVQIRADTPPCRGDPCPVYPSDSPVRYVLELSAGEAARLGLRPGHRLNFP